jgi:catechol 2,3-dioxygenase-like lactoylglutathione lyase family enzyme
MIANGPLFRKLDNLLLRVHDLDAAIEFYRHRLGHRVLWRSDEAVGLALRDTDAELVVHLNIGAEADVVVGNVDEAFVRFLNAGGEGVEPRSTLRLAAAPASAIPSAIIWSSSISPKAA